MTVGRAEAGEIGGWREGRLTYSSAPIARVAADLSRSLGVTVEAAPEVAARPFSGLIVVDADAERLMPRVAALLGVEARRAGIGWRLTAAAGETS